MLSIGANKIKALYLGENEIQQAYIGEKLVFEKGSSFPAVVGLAKVGVSVLKGG